MSGAGVRATEREIARGLADVLASVLQPDAPAIARVLARDVAQLLSLTGLERALALLASRAGREWPAEMTPTLECIRRLVAQSAEEGDVEPFRRADAELSAFGDALGQPSPEHPFAGDAESAPMPLSATDVLEDWIVEVARPGDLASVRLAPPVASALRAALDWLIGDRPQRRLTGAVQEGVLEIECGPVDDVGLGPAHQVLWSAGGNLGCETVAGASRWRLRVPTQTARETFLMIAQNQLRLAVPWAAVARVHIRTDAAKPPGAIPAPVLEPLVSLAPGRRGRPFVLVALGLKRAWLPADRLVWRLAAEPTLPSEAAPSAEWKRAVRTDDGEVYWVVDPALLLAGVELPPLPGGGLPVRERLSTPNDDSAHASESPAAPGVSIGNLSDLDVQALPAEGFALEPVESAPREPKRLTVLLREHVTPQELDPAAPTRSAGTTRLSATPWSPKSPPMPAPEKAQTPITQPASENAQTPRTAPANVSTQAPITAPAAASTQTPVPTPASDASPEMSSGHATESQAADAFSPVESAPLPGAAPAPEPVSPGMTSASAPGAEILAASSSTKRALVAEDSITARVFLTRLLEASGYEVLAVATAAELFEVLHAEPWALVCVDVELPDARGAELMLSLTRRGVSPDRVAALIRDAADREVAEAAGVVHVLRKPFERDAVRALLERVSPERGTGQ